MRVLVRVQVRVQGVGELGTMSSMTRSRRNSAPQWVSVTLWSIAGALLALGIVLSIATSSGWPLILAAGLAVPLLPLLPLIARRDRGYRARRPSATP